MEIRNPFHGPDLKSFYLNSTPGGAGNVHFGSIISGDYNPEDVSGRGEIKTEHAWMRRLTIPFPLQMKLLVEGVLRQVILDLVVNQEEGWNTRIREEIELSARVLMQDERIKIAPLRLMTAGQFFAGLDMFTGGDVPDYSVARYQISIAETAA